MYWALFYESQNFYTIYMYMYKRLIKRLNKCFIYNIHGCIHRHIHTPPPLLSSTKKERFKSKRFIDDFFLVTYVFSFSTSNIYWELAVLVHNAFGSLFESLRRRTAPPVFNNLSILVELSPWKAWALWKSHWSCLLLILSVFRSTVCARPWWIQQRVGLKCSNWAIQNKQNKNEINSENKTCSKLRDQGLR